MCANILIDLRKKYPQIRHILVLSYLPDENFVLPYGFDEAVYLQDIDSPPRFAISYTNRKLVETVDFVVVAAMRKCGGAKSAYDYAKKLYKSRINILTNEEDLFHEILSFDAERCLKEHQDKLANDKEYREAYEQERQRIYEIVVPEIEKLKKKNTRKRTKEYHKPVWVTVAKATEN